MHPVGFIIRIYHDSRSPKRQIKMDAKLTIREGVKWISDGYCERCCMYVVPR